MRTDEELRELLREPHDEARAHGNWESIAARRRRAPGVPARIAPRLAVGAGALALAAVALLAWLASRPAVPGPLRTHEGRVASGNVEGVSVALDDGSTIAIEEGARLEVLENAGDHVRFWLHEGAARFDVVPGGPRRWVVDSGLVTVEVLGTSFRVEHLPREVRVSVERGSVLVRGPTAPGGMQRLSAGESISVPLADPLAATDPPTEPQRVGAGAPDEHEPASPDTVRDAVRTRQGAPSTDPDPVIARPTSEVVERAEEPVGAELPAPSRMREADALRRAGRLDEAATLLRAIAEDAGAGADRALAAFTLARMELDRRDHPREAAEAFARAIELGLREPLLEDARARRVQALARFDAPAARAAASDYLARHPAGRWRAEVEQWADAP